MLWEAGYLHEYYFAAAHTRTIRHRVVRIFVFGLAYTKIRRLAWIPSYQHGILVRVLVIIIMVLRVFLQSFWTELATINFFTLFSLLCTWSTVLTAVTRKHTVVGLSGHIIWQNISKVSEEHAASSLMIQDVLSLYRSTMFLRNFLWISSMLKHVTFQKTVFLMIFHLSNICSWYKIGK